MKKLRIGGGIAGQVTDAQFRGMERDGLVDGYGRLSRRGIEIVQLALAARDKPKQDPPK